MLFSECCLDLKNEKELFSTREYIFQQAYFSLTNDDCYSSRLQTWYYFQKQMRKNSQIPLYTTIAAL